MSEQERSPQPETKEQHSLPKLGVGILLTAGAVKKTQGGERIEPDMEGKIRTLAAIEDLRIGVIRKIMIAGGQPAFAAPLAEIYCNYTRRYGLTDDQVEIYAAGMETGSDIRGAVQVLATENADDNLVVYSSGYHLGRAKDILERKGYTIATVPAEQKTLERWNKMKTKLLEKWFGFDQQQVISSVYSNEFVTYMAAREEKVKKVLVLDDLPIVGKVVQPGSRLVEFIARKQREKPHR